MRRLNCLTGLRSIVLNRKILTYKNWKIVIDRQASGSIRVRASIINQKDFVFFLSTRGRHEQSKYPGTNEVILDTQDFAKKYKLRTNMPEAAKKLFGGADFREQLEYITDFTFCIKDEDGILAFFFPHQADVLVMYAENVKTPRNMIRAFKQALDNLAALDIIDRDNDPIGRL